MKTNRAVRPRGLSVVTVLLWACPVFCADAERAEPLGSRSPLLPRVPVATGEHLERALEMP